MPSQLTNRRQEPSQRLPAAALLHFLAVPIVAALAAVPAVLYVTAPMRAEGGSLERLALLLQALAFAAIAVAIATAPLRFRRMRYELRSEELDIRAGAFTVTRIVIPLGRVQHVEVQRSFAGQLLGLSTLVVHTAAGGTEVPALDTEAADRLRDEITDRLREPDDL